MNNIQNYKILELLKNKSIYIISPHQDDAVLSAGMLMLSLKNHAKITVVNCFTQASTKPHTLSASKFLSVSGEKNAQILYKKRQIEDQEALNKLGVKIIDLKLTDALFRKKIKSNFLAKIVPELNYIYPTFKWHITKKIAKNDPASKLLEEKLKLLITNAIYIVPLGTGNHVDHKICKQVCEKIFPNIIYYSDFPYNLVNSEIKIAKYKKENFNGDINMKTKILKIYKTQYSNLFPKDIPNHSEFFYIPEKLLC